MKVMYEGSDLFWGVLDRLEEEKFNLGWRDGIPPEDLDEQVQWVTR